MQTVTVEFNDGTSITEPVSTKLGHQLLYEAGLGKSVRLPDGSVKVAVRSESVWNSEERDESS